MAKKNKSKTSSNPQNNSASKPVSFAPSSLFSNLIATEKHVAPQLNLSEQNWNDELFMSLQSSLSEEGKSKFTSLVSSFCEMGKGLKNLLSESEKKQKELEEKRLQLELDVADINEQEKKLNADKKIVEDQMKDVTTKVKDLENRENNAKDGFVKEKQAAILQAKTELDDIEKQKSKLQMELRHERQSAKEAIEKDSHDLFEKLDKKELEISKKKEEQLATFIERENLISKQEDELKLEKLKVDRQRSRFESDQRSAEQMEAQIRAELLDQHSGALTRKDLEIQKSISRLKVSDDELDKTKAKLSEFENFNRVLNGASPDMLIDERNGLRQQVKDANRKIAELEDARSNDDYEVILQDRDHLDKELKLVRPELAELKQRKHEYLKGVLEQENWAQEKRILEHHKQLITAHINDLESRIRGLTDAQQSQSAFPELIKMDSATYQRPAATVAVSNLKIFTEELQHRIALSQPENPLFFRKEDLQLFMGGLAMSQLHVFQGISGTGKTSLAKAFAVAVGGRCTDIAVQAGWRDRDDLLGHFNAFEKRYYEKDCLQALYRAQTPAEKDSINIILLDEMNLSRPEHYFSEFLSALEMNASKDRRISLMESPAANAPSLLEDGRYIRIPENVWFIGTANHDETTNEFADKTHDRAFVLELPRHDERFKPNLKWNRETYSYTSLKQVFSKAQKDYESEVLDILNFVSSSDLTKVLESDYGLGWGNRFERQAKKFLPVVKAAGGGFEQALDHLLATRMFRAGKVTGRYDINVAQSDEVLRALDKISNGPLKAFDPIKCKYALKKDRQRLERGA